MRVELIEDVAGGIELPEVEMGLDEIVSDLNSVNGGIEERLGEGEQFGEMRGIPKITADLHEHVGRDWTADAREAFTIVTECGLEQA